MELSYKLTFCASAALAVIAALMMITRRNAVHAALWLVLSFAAVGVVFLTLHAQFIAVLQITIYAGAIMVLFLFVIMLLNVKYTTPTTATGGRRGIGLAGVAMALVLAFMVATTLSGGAPSGTRLAEQPEGDAKIERFMRFDGNAENVAWEIFERHAFSFELVSVLLLAAIVGVMALVKRQRGGPPEDPVDEEEAG